MSEPITMTYEEILKLLPHRYPFLFVDGVEEIIPGEKIVAYKNVSFNDNFFQGHFPNDPIMPGVLQIEAMAQASGLMVLHGSEEHAGKTMLFLGADNVKWRRMVRPGDKLVMEVNFIKRRRAMVVVQGKTYVNGEVACEAELKCMIGA